MASRLHGAAERKIGPERQMHGAINLFVLQDDPTEGRLFIRADPKLAEGAVLLVLEKHR